MSDNPHAAYLRALGHTDAATALEAASLFGSPAAPAEPQQPAQPQQPPATPEQPPATPEQQRQAEGAALLAGLRQQLGHRFDGSDVPA